MKVRFFFLSFLLFAFSSQMEAQKWDFSKEKNGIKIYTRKEAGNNLKSYRGITAINASSEKVFNLIEDVNNTDWWDKNLTQIRVLHYEKNKYAQYYLVYDLPWPVTDRDVCVNVKVTFDFTTGAGKIEAVPLPGVIDIRKDMIRITSYRQTWTVTPIGKDMTKVVLEGFIDPAGNIPDWISNMLIVNSPFKIMSGIKQQLEK